MDADSNPHSLGTGHAEVGREVHNRLDRAYRVDVRSGWTGKPPPPHEADPMAIGGEEFRSSQSRMVGRS